MPLHRSDVLITNSSLADNTCQNSVFHWLQSVQMLDSSVHLMEIQRKIQGLLAAPNYHPLRRSELATALRLNAAQRREFRRVLAEMIEQGEVVRVRNDRFVLPQEADLVVGRITCNEKGFAFVIPEVSDAAARPAERPADIYIAEEDTGVALHGDKVVVRLNREKRRGGDRTSGRVIRILERAHEQSSAHCNRLVTFITSFPTTRVSGTTSTPSRPPWRASRP